MARAAGTRLGRLAAALTAVALLAVGTALASGGPSVDAVSGRDHSPALAPLGRVRAHVTDGAHVPVPVALGTAALVLGLVFVGLVVTGPAGRRVVLRPAELGSRSPPYGRH